MGLRDGSEGGFRASRHAVSTLLLRRGWGRRGDRVEEAGHERFRNLPNGVEGLTIRGPCHHASDRQYRSHAYPRAYGANEGLGFSLPNRIPDRSRKGEVLEASFWAPEMP
jgi:hypothetical protein